MADHALQFGTYVFLYPQSVNDNFKDLVPRTERMIGVSGGFDNYGSDPAPSEIGRIDVTFKLYAHSRDDMQALRDAVTQLAYQGKQTLTKTLQGALGSRWCYARVNSISLPEDWAEHSDLLQTGKIIFQVSDPHWYGSEDSDVISALAVTQDATVVHAGNSIAIARLVLTCGAGRTMVNPKVQRIVSGAVVDEVAFTGTVAASTSLIIDCQAKSVKNNGVDAYASFTFVHPDWIRLLPGDNTIRVLADNTAASLRTVTVYHYPTYV